MMEANFAAQERLIEDMALYIIKKPKDSWKPFEYMRAMEILFNMRQLMVENRGWNATKANPNTLLNQSTQLSIYEENSQSLIE